MTRAALTQGLRKVCRTCFTWKVKLIMHLNYEYKSCHNFVYYRNGKSFVKIAYEFQTGDNGPGAALRQEDTSIAWRYHVARPSEWQDLIRSIYRPQVRWSYK